METAEPTVDDTLALSERLVPPTERGQRLFRAALILAVVLHAMLLIEVGRSIPRTVGDRTGSPDAISVDLVTDADLKSRESVALPPAGAPAPAPSPAPEAQKPVEPEPPPPEPQPKAQEPQKAEPAPKAAEAPKVEKPKEASKSETPSPLPDFETELPDLATIPPPEEDAKPEETEREEPQPKKSEPAQEQTQPTPAKKKPQKQARLEPQAPDLQSAPPGRSASATRPPGITRSGENDEFGRGVVRALRMTMPPPRGIFGRVTVKLLLNANGDLADVQVLQASGTVLDQNVVFATKQTYFPLPPYNSSVADRTFIITYVYR